MKKVSLLFFVSLTLNILWENLHSFLYENYKNGEITEFILVRASLFDALLITIIALPFMYYTSLKNKIWLILILGTALAILNEWYGLSTGRWKYNELMPIVPIIKTGLTPTIQLGLLGYASMKIQRYLDLYCGEGGI